MTFRRGLRVFLSGRTGEACVYGETFPHRAELLQLGGRWDPHYGLWRFPAEMEETLQALADRVADPEDPRYYV